jgi:uncharacterized cofD-like protein
MKQVPASAHVTTERAKDPRPGAQPCALRVVALGGGTGLPNVLRGLRPILYGSAPRREQSAPRDRLVAIVATSDDGGSSGRLRAAFNIIPPGDIRNCLAALSDNHALIADIFQYRFDSGEGLTGHAIGNLVLTALADVTNDFARAVELASRVVGAHGTVLPATGEVVTLIAEFEDGRILSGETTISEATGRIARISLLPERPRQIPEVPEALLRADVIVVGPGSLFTSLLPPLVVPEVRQAVQASRAIRVLVGNLMTEPGAAGDYTLLEHVLTIERHLGAQIFDYVIYNTSPVPERLAEAYAAGGARPIVTGPFELRAFERMRIQPIGVPLLSEDPAGKVRHDPDRLAAVITALAHGKLGAWRARWEAGSH